MAALKCEARPQIVREMAGWLKGHRHIPYAEIELDGANGPGRVGLTSVGLFREKLEMIEMMEVLESQLLTLASRGSGSGSGSGKAPRAGPPVRSIIAGDLSTMPHALRYIVPFGTNDMYFSTESEPARLRREIQRYDRKDPFADHDTTAIGTKLDWVLFKDGEFEAKRTLVQPPAADAGIPRPSDHKWLMVDLVAK